MRCQSHQSVPVHVIFLPFPFHFTRKMVINPSFHADSFRPWKPPSTKAQQSHNSPSFPRYPTPTSITNIPPSSYTPMDSHSHRKHLPKAPANTYHPLPARPPAEVCAHFSACAPQDSRRQPTETPPSCDAAQRGGSSLNEMPTIPRPCPTIHQPEDRRSVIDISAKSPIPRDDTGVDDMSSDSMDGLEDITSFLDTQNSCPVDPAILSDETSEANRKRQVMPEICPVSTIEPGPDVLHTESLPVPRDTPDHSRSQYDTTSVTRPRHGQMIQKARLSDRDPENNIVSSETSKTNRPPPSCRKRRTKASETRPSKRRRTTATLRESDHSFTTFRRCFLDLPLDERLQFLSWLFEGALSNCISDCASFNGTLPAVGEAGDKDARLACHRSQPGDATRHSCGNDAPREGHRKGMPWSQEEEDLLKALRKDRNLQWSEVARHFTEQFPGRSQGSIQVYWSTKLK